MSRQPPSRTPLDRSLSLNPLAGLLSHPVDALIISIDGPAGTGKSTVSRLVASHLGLPHLDTGAYYRAATLLGLRSGLDLADGKTMSEAVGSARFDQEGPRMFLDGEDVSEEIRSPEVSKGVSVVAAHPGVREVLVSRQREWVAERGGSAVVEGRDIGSVVFPDAAVKVYLDATAEVRAERRAGETGEDVSTVLVDQEIRDGIDSGREASPLVVPEGAEIVDTTAQSLPQVVAVIVDLARTRSQG